MTFRMATDDIRPNEAHSRMSDEAYEAYVRTFYLYNTSIGDFLLLLDIMDLIK